MRKYTKFLLVGSISIVFSACNDNTPIHEYQPVPNSVGNVISLEQNWTEEMREAFYFTSQGSHIMPYEWFLYLEQATNDNLFRANDNVTSFRYIPSKPSKSWNPDGLPVGFVKDVDSDGKEWLGPTCAACHTTQIEYKDTIMRIDGGPAMGDFTAFNQQLVSAMSITYKEEAKFTRFAKNILKDKYNTENASQLRQQLLKQTEILAGRNLVNTSKVAYGYARVDAVGAIFNQVMVQNIDMPSNQRDSNAPVSYPFLWGTHQSDVVQWTGFAPNGPFGLGALIRNGGEVLGVYGEIDIPEDKSEILYQSSLQIVNLGKLENWVKDLRSPAWPAKILPAIDPEKASLGKIHYDQNCLSCHQVISRENEGEQYKAILILQTEVGTDPTEIEDIGRELDSGRFEGRKEMQVVGPTIEAKTTGLNPLVNSVTGALFAHPLESIGAILIENLGKNKDNALKTLEDYIRQYEEKFQTTKASTSGGTYKSRPLNGIWATAPYLHNGSVPNLYELLLPAKERSKEFYVGSLAFDPEKVGFETKVGDGLFKFSTEIKGNLNTGHEYAIELDETQRSELLEYLKTL